VLTGLIFCGFESVKNIQIHLFCFTGKGTKMKQKYTIIKDSKNKQLIVREFAELDKEILSLLCEETYEQKVILAAIKKGKEDLISALRTNNLYPPGNNLYPPGIYAKKIADAVKELYATKDRESEELFFDDRELLARASKPEARAAEEPIDEPEEDMDELLEDDFESDYENEDQPKKLDSSLKIADDEYGDVNEES
jgi:hypothetical protein